MLLRSVIDSDVDDASLGGAEVALSGNGRLQSLITAARRRQDTTVPLYATTAAQTMDAAKATSTYEGAMAAYSEAVYDAGYTSIDPRLYRELMRSFVGVWEFIASTKPHTWDVSKREEAAQVEMNAMAARREVMKASGLAFESGAGLSGYGYLGELPSAETIMAMKQAQTTQMLVQLAAQTAGMSRPITTARDYGITEVHAPVLGATLKAGQKTFLYFAAGAGMLGFLGFIIWMKSKRGK